MHYDWTFRFGKQTFDKIDVNAILQQNLIDDVDDNEEKEQKEENFDEIIDEDDEIVEEPGNNIRKKASKIDTSLLGVCTDREFLTSLTIIAGL